MKHISRTWRVEKKQNVLACALTGRRLILCFVLYVSTRCGITAAVDHPAVSSHFPFLFYCIHVRGSRSNSAVQSTVVVVPACPPCLGLPAPMCLLRCMATAQRSGIFSHHAEHCSSACNTAVGVGGGGDYTPHGDGQTPGKTNGSIFSRRWTISFVVHARAY